MIKTIYITRGDAGSMISRGLGSVYVWFHEPCLEVEEIGNGDMFSLDRGLRDELYGILYSKNTRFNFVYRSENYVKSEFGGKLIRNHDGVDFPEKLVELYEVYPSKLRYRHKVFGSGRKSGYAPSSCGDLFGYDDYIAQKIWKIVCDEFNNVDLRQWKEEDAVRPWYRFCVKFDIEVNLSVDDKGFANKTIQDIKQYVRSLDKPDNEIYKNNELLIMSCFGSAMEIIENNSKDL